MSLNGIINRYNEIDIISELVRKLVKHNSTEVQSQEKIKRNIMICQNITTS